MENVAGGRYNGGELPTTGIISDAEGRMRRRFAGARSRPVFEAMLREGREARGRGPAMPGANLIAAKRATG